jgi:hypothetical protein
MMLSHRRANLTDLVFVCGVGYLGFLAGRNVPLLALVAPPILTRHLAALVEDWQSRWQALEVPSPALSAGRAGLANWVSLLVVTLAVGVKVWLALPPALNEKELVRTLPFGAAEYVLREKPAGPLFNSYNFGGYLSWALYPDYPVFVDGRTDLYSDAFYRDYLTIANARPGYEAALDKYAARLAIVETGSVIADTLARDARWRLAYHDETASVFEKGTTP